MDMRMRFAEIDKHVKVMIKQMLRKIRIVDGQGGNMIMGDGIQ